MAYLAITLAPYHFTFNGPPNELGPVAVGMLAALLHQAVDIGHGFSFYGNDKANRLGEEARIMTHSVTSCVHGRIFLVCCGMMSFVQPNLN
tara:strand:- start:1242 stop:1514 length:273 start_codon:yes stop_codon:yes gene_type:complete